MNNYILILFLLISCSASQRTIKLEQKNSNQQIIAVLDLKSNRIVRLRFPKQIILGNNSDIKQSFIKVSYEYNSIETSIGDFLSLYVNNNNSLMKISNNKKKTIDPKKNKIYTIYTAHYLENKEDDLKEFTENLIDNGKDTLHIGTISEFKLKHGELFNNLTKNDSISVQFLDEGKLGEKITVPAEW